MEEEGKPRKSREKHKRNRYYTEDDDIFYRDTEKDDAKNYHDYDRENDEKETRSYRDTDAKESRSQRERDARREERRRRAQEEGKRPSPEGAREKHEKRSHGRRHKSSEKIYRSKSRERMQSRNRVESRERKSVRYKEGNNEEENERYHERGRSEERRRSRKHSEREKDCEGESEDEKHRRRREKTKSKRKEPEGNKENKYENEHEEYIQTEDSIEKTRRERSKERSKRKKSRDRTRRKEREEERNKIIESEDEITQTERRKSKHKLKRKHRSKDRRKNDIINDISFAAPSETYEEMKKTSIDWQPVNTPKTKSERRSKDRKKRHPEESASASDIEDTRKERRIKNKENIESISSKHDKLQKSSNEKYYEENLSENCLQKSTMDTQSHNSKPKKSQEFSDSKSSKSSSLTGYESDSKQNSSKRHSSKPHRNCVTEREENLPSQKFGKKHESNIKKEIRKKREPRLYHSDSEVDMKKNSKPKTNKHASNTNENETSSISSNDNQDIESLYDFYKDPEQKDEHKEVLIRASSRESSDPPKKISINQTNIRGKLIRVLFQRVKELLKETEDLRNERKTLTNRIKSLNEELLKLRHKEDDKHIKEAGLEKRLEMLADEMKITAKGTSFREEIHKILHDIQDKYQIHWREHESKIQQVQHDAEHNIQTLMKSIVGKYVQMSELKNANNDAMNEKSETNLPCTSEYKNNDKFSNLIKESVITNNFDKNNIRAVKSDSSLAEAKSAYYQTKATRNEMNRQTDNYCTDNNRQTNNYRYNLNQESSDYRNKNILEADYIKEKPRETDNYHNEVNLESENSTISNKAWFENLQSDYNPAKERDNRWENGNIKAGIQKLFMNEAIRTNQKKTRLNEPLFIDTGIDEVDNRAQTMHNPVLGQHTNTNKQDLLLQIASMPGHSEPEMTNRPNYYNNLSNQESALLRREKTYSGGDRDINNPRHDSMASINEKKMSYDTDNLSDLRAQSNRYFYDELKQPQFKLNVKEFWRQKLLKPAQQSGSAAKGRSENDQFDNKTVRNTY